MLGKIDDVVIDAITSESINRGSNVTDRKTEEGFINDHVEREPYELSISGIIVTGKNGGAWDRLKSIRDKHDNGDVVYYVHRGTARGVITSYNTTADNMRYGRRFNLTIKEVKTASPSVIQDAGGVGVSGVGNGGLQPVRGG